MTEETTVTVVITKDLARDILRRFVVEEEARIVFARRNREHLHAQIARGEPTTGPRAEWLLGSAQQVFELLLECGQVYDNTYPYDTITLGDFLDAIATARGHFVKAAGG